MDTEFKNKLYRAAGDLLRLMARYVATPTPSLGRALSDAVAEFKSILDPDNVELAEAISDLERALKEAGEKEGNGVPGKQLAGTFSTTLTYHITQELNRRRIPYTLKEADSFSTLLYVPAYSIKEAVAIINDVSLEHRRIRI
jgi:hypothetical protein